MTTVDTNICNYTPHADQNWPKKDGFVRISGIKDCHKWEQ